MVILNFSSKRDGNCEKIVKYLLDKKADAIIYNVNNETMMGCGNCNYQCLLKNEACPLNDEMVKIYDAIVNSELIIFLVPNYCDYPCANYFAFNERSCGYFQKDCKLLEKYLNIKKKFIVISNTNTINFKEVFQYQVDDEAEPDILFLQAKKFNSVSLEGTLLNNQIVKDLISSFIDDIYQEEESCMAIVLYQDKILMTKELIYDKLTCSLPKGHIEQNETHLSTAIRECFEETSIVITEEDFKMELTPFVIKFIDHHNQLIKKTIYPLVFEVKKCEQPVSKEKRVVGVEYMDIYKFLVLCTHNNVRTIVKNALGIDF